MKLKKLSLHNFGVYPDYTLHYAPGITGVIGENGHGKSTLVDPAQYFAITGNTPTRYKKGSFLRWRCGEGWTELHFEHEGEDYILTRYLESSQVQLEQVGGKTLYAQSDVQERMEAILGMTFEVFRETCFAEQGRFMDVVNMRHSERVAYFQRIARLKHAEDLRVMIQEHINDIPAYTFLERDLRRAEEDIAEARAESTQLKVGLVLARQTLAEASAALERKGGLAALELPETETIEDMMVTTRQNIEDTEQKLKALRKETESLLGEEIHISDSEEHLYRVWQDHTRISQELSIQLAALKRDYRELSSEFGENSGAVSARISEIDTELHKTRALKELAKTGVCPTCLREVPSDKSVDALKTEITELDQQLLSLRGYHKYVQQIVNARARIAALPKLPEAFDPTEFVKRKEAQAKWIRDIKERTQVVASIARLEEVLANYNTQLQDLQETRTISRADKAKFAEEANTVKKLRAKVEKLSTDISVNKAKLQERKGRLETLKIDEAQKMEYEELRVKLEAARSVLHRDRLPRLVMSKVIFCLNDRIEFYLSKFEANFSARISEDFEFLCDFLDSGDADKIAFTALSGGQKVALALAFRFALADVMGTSIPLLVLDEPTVHLDIKNKESMCEVMREVRSFAEKGVNIFVATHDDELASTFTRCITV